MMDNNMAEGLMSGMIVGTGMQQRESKAHKDEHAAGKGVLQARITELRKETEHMARSLKITDGQLKAKVIELDSLINTFKALGGPLGVHAQ